MRLKYEFCRLLLITFSRIMKKINTSSTLVFKDPLVIAEGHDNIFLQFELLSALVTDMTTEFSAVTVSSSSSFASKQFVVIDAVVSYHFPLSQRVPLRSTTMFVFNDKQKIVSHEDMWSVSDLIQNIPIIGWIYGDTGRKINALVSNQLYSFCRGTVLRLRDMVGYKRTPQVYI